VLKAFAMRSFGVAAYNSGVSSSRNRCGFTIWVLIPFSPSELVGISSRSLSPVMRNSVSISLHNERQWSSFASLDRMMRADTLTRVADPMSPSIFSWMKASCSPVSFPESFEKTPAESAILFS